MVDGTMYTSGTWGYVYALDAATGKELWKFDPRADPRAARNPCCDLVNRGVAVWKGKVFVASVDGRLHALDATTGKELWSADTIVDHKLPYSSTGAVYIAGDLAVIGNSGADMDKGGVRGYVSAYDVETGKLAWRFYTVPGAPGQPPEDPAMALAAKTWNRHRAPEYKGGGTVWDGFAYDSDLKLVYFGTANAAPFDLRLIGGKPMDALFTASIVALHADTGRLAWYYQTTPGDHWDFDAVQKLILADLKIGGSTRPVIMQANKNGFFYVLDRRTGKLISAKNFTFVNWASGIDMKTGRPRLTKEANWYSGPKTVYPSWAGGHSWPPMSFNPETGLVYIPAIDAPSVWVDLLHNGGRIKFINSFFTAIGLFPDETYDAASVEALLRADTRSQEARGHAQGQAAAGIHQGLGPSRTKNGLGARDDVWRARIRRRGDEHRRQSRVPGSGQWRALGLCCRHRESPEDNSDRKPHHGRADNLCRWRRAICRCSGRLWRNGHGRRTDPAYERRAEIRERKPDHRLQARRRRRADADGPQGRALPEAARKQGEPRRDPGGGDQIHRAMLALPYARAEHYARSAEDAAAGPSYVQGHPARRRLRPNGHGELRGHPERAGCRKHTRLSHRAELAGL